MAFSGDASLDGVNSVLPTNHGIFTVFSFSELEQVFYLGLADLGKSVPTDTNNVYTSDQDNYIDICMDLQNRPDIAADDLIVRLNCDADEGSIVYPPKGKAYQCKPQEVILTGEHAYAYFSKYWSSN